MTGKPNPVECNANLPGDIYLSAQLSPADAGQAGQEVGTTHAVARGGGLGRRAQLA